ncbi:hypothetical protein Tco_1156318 [Tanacetum coccineum]
MDVYAPPYIIDVDEDDDLINDKDALPRDLADSDDEDLDNDDDDVSVMLADVARGHGDDGSGDDRPPPGQIPTGCRGKGTRKPNRRGRKAGRLNTYGQTRNLGLMRITDQWGPQQIWFKFNDRGKLMPLGDCAAHWSNLLGEIIREFLMHYPSWHKIEPERKVGVMENIRLSLLRQKLVRVKDMHGIS